MSLADIRQQNSEVASSRDPGSMTSLSSESLRTVMRRLPSPVTVVTSAVEAEIRGITIGSFASTSLEPALISFNVSRESPMLDLLTRSGMFVVHFLRDSQSSLSERFAVPNLSGTEQFDQVDFALSDTGLPLLDGVLARLSCSVHAMHDAGDHMIVIGLVRESTELEEGQPLLYYDRRYVSVGSSEATDGRRSGGTGTS